MGGFALAFLQEGRGQPVLSIMYNPSQTPLKRICIVYAKYTVYVRNIYTVDPHYMQNTKYTQYMQYMQSEYTQCVARTTGAQHNVQSKPDTVA